jgi:hypothetical protein
VNATFDSHTHASLATPVGRQRQDHPIFSAIVAQPLKPPDQLEEMLAHVGADVLGLDRVGLDDDKEALNRDCGSGEAYCAAPRTQIVERSIERCPARRCGRTEGVRGRCHLLRIWRPGRPGEKDPPELLIEA